MNFRQVLGNQIGGNKFKGLEMGNIGTDDPEICGVKKRKRGGVTGELLA